MAKTKTKTKTKIEEIFDKTAQLNIRAENKLAEIEYWREFASKTTIVLNGISGGSNKKRNSSKVEDSVCKIMDIEESLKEDMNKIIELKEQAMRIIEKIDAPVYRDILINKYIYGKRWDEIAASIGYCYVHTLRLHKKALAKLYETEGGGKNGQ